MIKGTLPIEYKPLINYLLNQKKGETMEKKLKIIEGLKDLLEKELESKQDAIKIVTEGIIKNREENSHSEDSSKMVEMSASQTIQQNSISTINRGREIAENIRILPQEKIVVGALITALFNKKEKKLIFVIPKELESMTGKKIIVGGEEITTIGTKAPLLETMRSKKINETFPFLKMEIKIISIE